jgi:hypothetical protein
MNLVWVIIPVLVLLMLYILHIREFFSVVPQEWKERKELYMMSLYDFIADPRTNLKYFKLIPSPRENEVIPTIDLDGLRAIFNEKLTANGLNPANYNQDFLNIRNIASGAQTAYTYQDYLDHYEQRIYFFARQDIALNGPKMLPQDKVQRAQRLWSQIAQLYMQFPQPSTES